MTARKAKATLAYDLPATPTLAVTVGGEAYEARLGVLAGILDLPGLVDGWRALAEAGGDVAEVSARVEELDERTRRFVLGHELGHHLYHRGQNRVFMDRHTLLIPSKQEIEADTFSVCLMQPHPDELLLEGETTEQLAIRLGVDLRLAELYQTEIIRNRRRE